MSLTILRKTFIVLSALSLGLIGCGKEEEEEVGNDVAGTWESSCSRYYTDAYILSADVCNDPDSSPSSGNASSCKEVYELYYYTDTAVFADASGEQTYPSLNQTRTIFYNSSDDEAKKCKAADKVSALTVEYSYQLKPSGLLDTTEVNEDNGFPAKSSGINLQLVSASMSYDSSTIVASRNAEYACAFDDWEVEEAKTLTNQDNCLYHSINLTHGSQYYSATYESDGLFKSSFIEGTSFHSIYKIDSSETPNQLGLGDLFGMLEGGVSYDATEATAKSQTTEDGSSDARRQKSLTFTLAKSS